MSQKTQELFLLTLGKSGNLSALASTAVKIGLIIPVCCLIGNRMVNEHLQGGLKMKKVPGR